ncbi:MAG TPA: TonB-dependent receptor [Acidobacteria bacterium]|nr:TonB-dependent receptor [Acidobacteriota bacterium]
MRTISTSALWGAPALLALASLILMPASNATEDSPGESASPTDSEVVEEVIVTATRAGEDTPATHSNLSKEAIDEQYWAQDLPMLLNSLPSVYSYSDSGNGIGYSYMRIRGFDQRRINVTINGVPLNDAESHEVFWVDLPNFADSLQDVQVQRGAGTVLYGPGAIGGAVNLETARLTPGETFNAEFGIGSWGTSKVTAGWKSDLLAGRWVLGLQLSRMATEGYRDQSWTRMGLAFFTAQRLGTNNLLRINLYGGRENSHLAYEGLTREQLAVDRKANPLSWPGEQDRFSQPHFELIHEWQASRNLEVANTVYAFYGRGYFDQFREEKDWFELHLAESYGEGRATEVFRQRWIKEWDYGWLPRITLQHGRGKLTAGAEVRIHRAEHYGIVNAQNLPAGTESGFRYYDYQLPKTSTTFFVQEEWKPGEDLTVLAGLQYVQHRWSLEQDRVTGIDYDVRYAWWAPRLGVHWRINPRLGGYLSLARTRREPTVKDLFDPQDAWDAPAFRNVDPSGRATGPIPREERLDDLEVGLEYNSERLLVKGTVYRMDFRDEIIYLGSINDLGQALTGNAERSRHEGLELEAAWAPAPRWRLAGSVTVSDDRNLRYIEDGWAGKVDYSGRRIAGFPGSLARLTAAWSPSWGRVEIGGQHVGRIFVDNSQSREASTDPFTLWHLDLLYKLPGGRDSRYSLRLRVENLFDSEYEAYGYNWGVPTFIPGATRNLFMMLSWKPAR